MKNAVIVLALVGCALLLAILLRDPAVQAEQEKVAVDESLRARVESLEDLLSFHSHDRELRSLGARLEALEAESNKERRIQPSTEASIQPQRASDSGELNKLRQDVQSLASKLSTLERSVSPLKQEIDKLKLNLNRVESNVARIDLRR